MCFYFICFVLYLSKVFEKCLKGVDLREEGRRCACFVSRRAPKQIRRNPTGGVVNNYFSSKMGGSKEEGFLHRSSAPESISKLILFCVPSLSDVDIFYFSPPLCYAVWLPFFVVVVPFARFLCLCRCAAPTSSPRSFRNISCSVGSPR